MMKLYAVRVLLLAIFLFSLKITDAQNFQLLKDINAQKNSYPSNYVGDTSSFAVLAGKSFFAADDGKHGKELWVSDGTTTGTKLVKDINPGTASAYVQSAFAYKDKVYFFATSNLVYQQLWQSDGTEAGTKMVKDSLAYAMSYIIRTQSFIEYKDKLYFTVSDPYFNEELWTTDGTTAGTQTFINFNSAEYGYSNDVRNLKVCNGLLYFTSSFDQRLWVTDGTTPNTHMINFKGFNQYSNFADLTVSDNKLYFVHASDIWQTSGDSLSTIKLTQSAGLIASMSILNNNIYWIGNIPQSPGVKLVKYNPLMYYSLEPIKDLDNETGYISGDFVQQINDSLLFFTSADSIGNPRLWVTDGTSAGTEMLLNDKQASNNFFSWKNKLYFSHSDKTYGQEVWITDGSKAGMKMFKDINPGIFNSSPVFFSSMDSLLVFTAKTNTAGVEFWKTNGTAEGTSLVKNINESSTDNSYPLFYPGMYDTINGKLIFIAHDGVHGNELWSSDGTTSGTFLTTDALPGNNSGLVYETGHEIKTKFKGYEYFYAASDTNVNALWKTNGTIGSTQFVSNVYTPASGIRARGLGATPNMLFTIVGPEGVINISDSLNSGSRLYAYDGNDEPALLKSAFFPAFVRSQKGRLLNVDNNILFFIDPYNVEYGGIQLWKSNGTIQGTQLVKTLYDGQVSRSPYVGGITKFQDIVFFLANSGYGSESPDYDNQKFYLWKTNATEAGTSIVKKVEALEIMPVVAGNKLYFIGKDDTNGDELWVTDGTESGTHIVKDIFPGTAGSNIREISVLNDIVYFIANDGSHTRGIWKSDGTENGTVYVAGSNIGSTLVAGKDLIYFLQDNKILQSDGTETGTKELATTGLENVNNLQILIYALDKIFVTGYNYQLGLETYVSNDVVLPLKSLKLSGSLNGNNASLQWKAEHDNTTKYFVLQRSVNGREFSPIAKVDAKNNAVINNYTYTDVNISLLNTSTIYYRLQVIDVNGKIEYSNIVTVNLNTLTRVLLSPNPAKSFVNLTSSAAIGNATILFIDASGKTVYQTKKTVSAGEVITIPVNHLASGIYTAQIYSGNNKVQEIKFMKQ